LQGEITVPGGLGNPISGRPFVRLGRVNQRGSFSNAPNADLLTKEQKENYVLYMFLREAGMLKVFVEEAAALASIALFVGMIAVWAQLIPQL
jgi:hypothetical protein